MRYFEISGETLPEGVTRKPMSDAVLAAQTLYVSGRIGLLPQTGKPPAQLADEVRCLMENLCGVLAGAEMTVRDLVSVTVFATNVADYGAFNAVYLEYFPESKLPARAFIGSGPLLFGARFELTAIAARTGGDPGH